MDMTLFKETVSQCYKNMGDCYSEGDYAKAVTKATYYGEAAMNSINAKIRSVVDNLPQHVTTEIFSESVSSVFKTIWGAIVRLFGEIARIAFSFKMWIMGGKDGYINRLNTIKRYLQSSGSMELTLPVIKGSKDTSCVNGFIELNNVLMGFASGNTFAQAVTDDKGIVKWSPKGDGDMSAAQTLADSQSRSRSAQTVDSIDGRYNTLIDILTIPIDLKLINFTRSSLSELHEFTTNVRKGIVRRGIAAQITGDYYGDNLEDVFELRKSKVNFKELYGAIDATIELTNTSFADKNIQNKLYFGDILKRMVKEMKVDAKTMSKTLGEDTDIKGDIIKSCAVVTNTILNDYIKTTQSVKMVINKITKQLLKEVKVEKV